MAEGLEPWALQFFESQNELTAWATNSGSTSVNVS